MRGKLLLLAFIAAAMSAAPPARAAEPPLAVPVQGEPFRAVLMGADAAGKLRFDVASSPREIAAADLVTWGELVEPGGGIRIVLVGGGWIVADAVRIENERLHGTAQSCGELDLPLELIAGIVLRPPSDRATLDRWLERIAAAGGQTDRLLLDNGDELSGTLAGIGEKVIPLETDAGKVEVELEKVSSVIFNPTLVYKARTTGLRTLIGLADGSRLTAVQWTADKSSARVKLAGGAELKTPTAAIVALQPLGGRVTYLSDLKPSGYRHVPYLQLTWPLQADRSVLGSQLRACGRVVAKGLGMHSPSRVTYDLDGEYLRFDAEVAIDAEAGPRGSVVFRVFTDDGSGAWQLRSTSEIVRGGQPCVSISVDLKGARRLSLLVDYADRGDELDHADWLNARLVR